MSQTRILCPKCGAPQAWCQCKSFTTVSDVPGCTTNEDLTVTHEEETTTCVLPPEPYLILMRAGLDPDAEHDRVSNGHGRAEKAGDRMAAESENKTVR